MILKLALRNLIGTGLRTWLNVIVLSFTYVAIIWTQGLNNGMLEQSSRAMIKADVQDGQLWQENYDPLDPFSIDDSFCEIPNFYKSLDLGLDYVPIGIIRAVAYPNGKMKQILLKGIDHKQKLINLPTDFLKKKKDLIPAIIGKRMAKSSQLSKDDVLTIRWKNINGTYDAIDIEIVKIMKTDVPSLDNNQIWIDFDELQQMMKTQNFATIIVLKDSEIASNIKEGWIFKSRDYLLSDLKNLVRMKTVSSSVLYGILIFLSVIAIFDTQVLSIFKRRKEMGTLMALGMTRKNLIALFTLEGAILGIFATFIGALYGIPLLIFTSIKGIPLPEVTDSYSLAALSKTLYPSYSIFLILGTIILVFTISTIISYLPTRKIADLNPTDALKGKFTSIKRNQ